MDFIDISFSLLENYPCRARFKASLSSHELNEDFSVETERLEYVPNRQMLPAVDSSESHTHICGVYL